VLRSTRVPTADPEAAEPRIRSPSQVPGHGGVLDYGWTLADHHQGGELAPSFAVATSWLAHRSSGAQKRSDLTFEATAGLHAQRLVHRYGQRQHPRLPREVHLESVTDCSGLSRRRRYS
jgi:hypothetical protein